MLDLNDPEGRVEAARVAEAARRSVSQRHAEYERLLPHWLFYLHSYEGGPSYTQNPQYLLSHARETAEDRAFRLRRVVYYNYCRSLIEVYTSYLYKKEVVRESDNPAYREFLENVDLRGNSINSFMSRYVAPMSQVFGTVFVLIDLPQAPAGLSTAFEERLLGIRPYARVVLPLHVLDWELDGFGRFVWVKLKEPAPSSRGPFDETGARRRRYRIWTRRRWFLLDEDGNFLNPGGPEGEPHPAGRVPLIAVHNERSTLNQLMGVSALQDIAPCCQRIYNLASLLDEFLYKQCFSFLAWPGDVDVERLSASNVATLDPETRQLPTYITPPTDPARFIESQIEKNIQEIYRIARIRYAVTETHAESGVARAIEFHDTDNVLARKARNLEQAEREMAEVFFRWTGEPNDARIVYPKDFSIRAVNEEVEEATRLMRLNLSRTLNARLAKRLVKRLLPGIGPEEEENIFSEIEDACGTPTES